MAKVTIKRCLLGSLALLFCLGCAPAYHSYSGCRVPCKYCVPAPLPHTHYPGCACHSCAAERHLAGVQTNASLRAEPGEDAGQPDAQNAD